MTSARESIDSAYILYDRGYWREAMTLLKNVREATPEENCEKYVLAGWIDWKMKLKNEAMMIWQEVIKSKEANNATLSSAHAGLGIYYAEKGNKKKALEHTKLAQDLLPEDATLQQSKNLNSCGIVMAKIGEFRRAEEILKKVAQINENLEKSGDPEIAKEAKHQRGKNGYNLASLVYIPQRMWSVAIKELKNRVVPRYVEVGAETDLAAAYHRIAEAYEAIRDYDNALHFEELSLNLWEKHSDDPKRAETARGNINRIKNKMRK